MRDRAAPAPPERSAGGPPGQARLPRAAPWRAPPLSAPCHRGLRGQLRPPAARGRSQAVPAGRRGAGALRDRPADTSAGPAPGADPSRPPHSSAISRASCAAMRIISLLPVSAPRCARIPATSDRSSRFSSGLRGVRFGGGALLQLRGFLFGRGDLTADGPAGPPGRAGISHMRPGQLFHSRAGRAFFSRFQRVSSYRRPGLHPPRRRPGSHDFIGDQSGGSAFKGLSPRQPRRRCLVAGPLVAVLARQLRREGVGPVRALPQRLQLRFNGGDLFLQPRAAFTIWRIPRLFRSAQRSISRCSSARRRRRSSRAAVIPAS